MLWSAAVLGRVLEVVTRVESRVTALPFCNSKMSHSRAHSKSSSHPFYRTQVKFLPLKSMHRSGVAAGLCALFEVPFPFSPPSPPPSYLLGSSADCAAEPDPFLPSFLPFHTLSHPSSNYWNPPSFYGHGRARIHLTLARQECIRQGCCVPAKQVRSPLWLCRRKQAGSHLPACHCLVFFPLKHSLMWGENIHLHLTCPVRQQCTRCCVDPFPSFVPWPQAQAQPLPSPGQIDWFDLLALEGTLKSLLVTCCMYR